MIMEKNNLVLTETDLQQNYAREGRQSAGCGGVRERKEEKKESMNRQERNKVCERVHKS